MSLPDDIFGGGHTPKSEAEVPKQVAAADEPVAEQPPIPEADQEERDYRALPALNASGLKALKRSPLHYWAEFVDPDRAPKEPTKAMHIGTALHALVLEGEERWAVEPDVNKRTKAGKAELAEFLANVPDGVPVLKQEDADMILRMANNVHACPEAQELLNLPGRKTEHVLTWDDESTGIACKARLDMVAWSPNEVIVVDIKTTKDARPAEFARQIATLDYHVQAAFYLDAAIAAHDQEPFGSLLPHIGRAGKIPDLISEFFFIAVENIHPFAVNVFRLHAGALDQARREINKLMEIYNTCQESGIWPGYAVDNYAGLHLPKWAQDEESFHAQNN